MRCARCYRACKDTEIRKALIADKQKRDEEWLNIYWWGCPLFAAAAHGDWPISERWRPIENYRGQYDVSDLGRVRCWYYNVAGVYYKRAVPRLVKSSVNSGGYPGLHLVDWHTGGGHQHTVHSLVCETFRGFRPSKNYVVGHRNGNPLDNRLSNLGWITYRENEADKERHGTKMFGERNHGAKLSAPQVIEMRERKSRGESIYTLSKVFGVRPTVISKICRRQAWRHIP